VGTCLGVATTSDAGTAVTPGATVATGVALSWPHAAKSKTAAAASMNNNLINTSQPKNLDVFFQTTLKKIANW
jgi:hypothetical protein